MKTPQSRLVVLSAAAIMVLAACSGSTSSTWTVAPALPTSTAGPSGLASAVPTAAPASAAPASGGTSAAPGTPPASGAPASPTASGAASPGAGQVIKLELTGALSITQDGQPVTELTVKEGETVHFVIDNTAGFTHNFHIGTPDQLTQAAPDLMGIPDWTSGVKEFDYVVTADTANLQFGCTVPGHYAPMHGTFQVVP